MDPCGSFIVQLWTTGNYHWYSHHDNSKRTIMTHNLSCRYLKHEIPAPYSMPGKPGRFTSVCWHPEDALRIILTTSGELHELDVH